MVLQRLIWEVDNWRFREASDEHTLPVVRNIEHILGCSKAITFVAINDLNLDENGVDKR